jgi:hypothetical protein
MFRELPSFSTSTRSKDLCSTVTIVSPRMSNLDKDKEACYKFPVRRSTSVDKKYFSKAKKTSQYNGSSRGNILNTLMMTSPRVATEYSELSTQFPKIFQRDDSYDIERVVAEEESVLLRSEKKKFFTEIPTKPKSYLFNTKNMWRDN